MPLTTKLFQALVLLAGLTGMCGSCFAQSAAIEALPTEHQALVKAFVQNYRTSTPITPIPEDSLTEAEAYRIADAYVSELLETEGSVAGYKVGTFEAGMYDNGPVDGWSGPVTAVMFSDGLHQNGHHVSVDLLQLQFRRV